MPIDHDRANLKPKPKTKEYEYTDRCPYCGSDKWEEPFKNDSDIRVCLGCGAGFKLVEGHFIHDPTYDQEQVVLQNTHESARNKKVVPGQYTYEEEQPTEGNTDGSKSN